MARRKISKKPVTPDSKYQSIEVSKLINQIMERGKKTVAKNIVYSAFEIMEKKKKEDPLQIFLKALDNVAPRMEVRGKRVGGANYQVPFRVTKERGEALAMRWIIAAAKAKSGTSMDRRLAGELMQAFDNDGASVKKRDNTHRMAQANRAFAHLAGPRRKR